MLQQIKNINGKIIFEGKFGTLKEAAEAAVKRGTNLQGANLRDANLQDANLRYANLCGANLRGADLQGAKLQDADLENADLQGANLQCANLRDAKLWGADLRGADLQYANLRGANLQCANLRGANLQGAKLQDADLEGANLQNANLQDANLQNADLQNADLWGVKLDNNIPVITNIHSSIYAATSQPGALDMGAWHSCETTHCRAGWVIILAGEAGKQLEHLLGTPTTAALIYVKSDPDLDKIPDFYADDKESLADMKNLAEKEILNVTTN